MKVSPPTIPRIKLPVVHQPCLRSFHFPAVSSQAFAALFAPSGDAGNDAPPVAGIPILLGVVALVGVQFGRTSPRSTQRAVDWWHGIEELFEHGGIRDVGSSQYRDQWQAVPVRQHVILAARFPTVGRVRTCFRPPRGAGTLMLSMFARDQSICPARPSRSSST